MTTRINPQDSTLAEPPAYEALRGRRGYEQYFKTLDHYKRTGSVPSLTSFAPDTARATLSEPK